MKQESRNEFRISTVTNCRELNDTVHGISMQTRHLIGERQTLYHMNIGKDGYDAGLMRAS